MTSLSPSIATEYSLSPYDTDSLVILIDYCIDGIDGAVLWSDGLRSVLNDEERRLLRRRLRSEVFERPHSAVYEFTSAYSGGDDPEDFSAPLEDFANGIEREFPGDGRAARAAARIRELRWEWIEEHDEPSSQSGGPTDTYRAGASLSVPISGERSVFDDLIPSSLPKS